MSYLEVSGPWMMRWMVERPTLYSVARSARDTSPSAYRRRIERRAGSGSLGCLPLSCYIEEADRWSDNPVTGL
ncbi:hypothetical protein ACSDR0_38545 [Streptosporangium sp. G11]|uniref:hypothetical protein n=1 Tax=Streptosporangium sp. G11 TaxID=3436926 RepID=UPI003EB6BBCB